MTSVLDASALLAFLHDEPGADPVRDALDGGIVSSVNWAKVVQKSLLRRADVTGMQEEFSEVGVIIEPFTPEHTEIAAHLWQKTRRHGLSLGGPHLSGPDYGKKSTCADGRPDLGRTGAGCRDPVVTMKEEWA